MKWLTAFLLFVPSVVLANNLTGFWYTEGGNKIPRQQFYPQGGCSSCTLTRVWDGTNINQFGAQNETVGGALYLLNGGGSDATNVMVSVSSMTCAGGTGIVSVAVSSMNVWDTTTRPTQLFNVIYSSISGISDIPYGHSEFNEKSYPPRFRPIGALLWANRPDHDAYYPIGLVPMEEFAVSSFTVAQSSSQAVWIDTYISSNVLAGTCTGFVTVTEDVNISTVIPYHVLVYNFKMPDSHYFPTTAFVDGVQIDKRFNGGTTDLAGRQHVSMLLHAHGLSSTMGDAPDINTNRFPSAEYQNYLTGTQYTRVNGYGNARGTGIGQSLYIIGTYDSEHGDPNFSPTNITQFCQYAHDWSVNLAPYTGVRAAEYFADEASSTTMVNVNERWATWLATACSIPGSAIHSWVTGDVPTIKTYAPHVDMPISAAVMDHDPNHPYPNEAGFAYTPSTWQAAVNSYLTTGTSQTWRYNSNVYGTGAYFAPEEEGYVTRANFWGWWMKLCLEGPSPGTCKGGHFNWHVNYWFDENNYGGANQAGLNEFPQRVRTFGFTTIFNDPQWGIRGFNYSQGDGVLIWPGKDTIMPNNSYGFEGAIATWPLKMYRRGVDDADIMSMASQVNLAVTSTTVHSLISQALWEVPCTSQLDCSYNNTTDRTWSYDPNAYTTGIETLYKILAGILPPSPPPTSSNQFKGNAQLKGNILIQ